METYECFWRKDMNQFEHEKWKEPEERKPEIPQEIRDVNNQLYSVKVLVGELERHLAAGAIVKANNDAADLTLAANKLFNLTYKVAFPKGTT